MQIITQDHYDLMDMFERIYKGEFRLDREVEKKDWSRGFVYQHGDANRMFKAFRHGVAYGVAITR